MSWGPGDVEAWSLEAGQRGNRPKTAETGSTQRPIMSVMFPLGVPDLGCR